MQASLVGGVQAPAAQVHGNARQAASQQPCQPASSAQLAAGLHNATGEYNCFLNVIVQCLWHCTCFRTAVMAWPTAVFQVKSCPCNQHACLHRCCLLGCVALHTAQYVRSTQLLRGLLMYLHH